MQWNGWIWLIVAGLLVLILLVALVSGANPNLGSRFRTPVWLPMPEPPEPPRTERAAVTPALEPHVVAMLDLLGFSDRTRRAEQAGNGEALFQELRDAYQEAEAFTAPRPGSLFGLNWVARFFTDNLLLAFREDQPLQPSHALLNVAGVQTVFTKRGFLLRGGLARGPFAESGAVVFGSVMSVAHDLEATLAKDPRVVVTTDLVGRYLQERKGHPGDETVWQRLLLRDRDGLCFINYLIVASTELAEGKQVINGFVEDILAAHRAFIVRGLTDFANAPRVLTKFKWAASYHDFFCRSLVGAPTLLIGAAPGVEFAVV